MVKKKSIQYVCLFTNNTKLHSKYFSVLPLSSVISMKTHTVLSPVKGCQFIFDIDFLLSSMKNLSEVEDRPAALCSHVCLTLSSKCLLSSSVCRYNYEFDWIFVLAIEVAWRAWLRPELQICQYLSLSSLHVMTFTRSLGPLTLASSLVSALQKPNSMYICVCLFVPTAEGDVPTRAW